ncbi:hypothetical protein ES703_49728 [subsurface metagenome]
MIYYVDKPEITTEIIIRSLGGAPYLVASSYTPIEYDKLNYFFTLMKNNQDIPKKLFNAEADYKAQCIEEGKIENQKEGLIKCILKTCTDLMKEKKLGIDEFLFIFIHYLDKWDTNNNIKVEIEKYLWKSLYEEKGTREFIEKNFMKSISAESSLIKQFFELPQLYISIPTYNPSEDKELILGSKEKSETTIKVYMEDGNRRIEGINISHKDVLENFCLLVIVPDFIVHNSDVRERTKKIFEMFLEKSVWSLVFFPELRKYFFNNYDKFKLEDL